MTEYHCLACKEYFDAESSSPAQCPKCTSTHVAPVTLITGPGWFNKRNGILAAWGSLGGVLGVAAGGFVGFLLRPDLSGVRVSFSAAVTRGTYLPETQQALVPLAETSFNHMLLDAAIGCIFGAALLALLGHAFARPGKRGQ